MAVLDFDKVVPRLTRQAQIDARVVTVAHLAFEALVASGARNESPSNDGLGEPVRYLRIDADANAVDLQQFKGKTQLSFAARGRFRHPGPAAGPDQTFHAAGVDAVGIVFPGADPHPGDKAIVARKELPFDERARVGNKHRRSLTESAPRRR